ncbi:HIT family protein [Candidatus Phytoplasma oryzae]|nr:HIT family protein [Candidatus Phytoplasma oryzae]
MATIFNKIIEKKIPSYIIYEDELIISFLDIYPYTKGHTLVVTKKDYRSILEVPRHIFLHMFDIIQKMSKVLIKTLNAEGINLLNNNGKVSGQTIFHYHVHLIPRFDEKEVNLVFNNNYNFSQNDYKKICQDIRKKWKKYY